VPHRLTSIYPRIWFTVGFILACVAILNVIFSDPNGTQPANVALMSVLLAWCAVLAVRGWRCATLLARARRSLVRGLVRTGSWP
jgi:ABC-type Na+ efflux pump permease subunit